MCPMVLRATGNHLLVKARGAATGEADVAGELITTLGWNAALIYSLADGLDGDSGKVINAFKCSAAWYMHQAVDANGDGITDEPVFRVALFYMTAPNEINIEDTKAACKAWWEGSHKLYEWDMLTGGNTLPYEEGEEEPAELDYTDLTVQVDPELGAKALMIWAWAANPVNEEAEEKYTPDGTDYVPDAIDIKNPKVYVEIVPADIDPDVPQVLETIAEWSDLSFESQVVSHVPDYICRPFTTPAEALQLLCDSAPAGRLLWAVYEEDTIRVWVGYSGVTHTFPLGYPGITTSVGLKDGGRLDVVRVLYDSADTDDRFDTGDVLAGTGASTFAPAEPQDGDRVGILDLRGGNALSESDAKAAGSAYKLYCNAEEYVGTVTFYNVEGAWAIRAGDKLNHGPIVGGLVTSTEIDVDADTVTIAIGGYPLSPFKAPEGRASSLSQRTDSDVKTIPEWQRWASIRYGNKRGRI